MTVLRASRRRGQSLVEFAIMTPIFFLAIFGVLEIGRLLLTQMTLQHALREAGRFAVTGQHLVDPAHPGNTLSRIDSITQVARNTAAGVDVSSIRISSTLGGNGSAGAPRDTVTIAMTASLKLFTPLIGRYFGTNGVYTFTVGTTFQNEPFNPSQTN